jgi:Domain of unknown function (DUF5122) beta-propeller
MLVDGGFDGASAVTVQSDGKIMAVGVTMDSNFSEIVALVRYDTTGNLDPTFGAGGKVAIDFQNSAFDNNGWRACWKCPHRQERHFLFHTLFELVRLAQLDKLVAD